ILERAVKCLEPGGRLGMIVPDGVLNNSSDASRCPALRRFLLENGHLLAVVSLPDYAFRKAGAQNKTSLFFFQRFRSEEEQRFRGTYDAAFAEAVRGDMVGGQARDVALLEALEAHDHQVFVQRPKGAGIPHRAAAR